MNRRLVVQYEFPHNEWFVTQYFHKAAQFLVDNNKDIEFSFINSGSLSNRDSYTRNSAHMMTIINPDNGKYILQSFWDKNICLFNKNSWDPDRMVQLLCSAGLNKKEYNDFFTNLTDLNCVPIDYDNVFTPFTYFPYTTRAARYIEEFFPKRDLTNIQDKMVFRGALYNERSFLQQHLHNGNDILVENITNSYKDAPEYLYEHIFNLCSLSINGAAEICNRDIELFGLGMPVIRTELNLEFSNKLIPDFHYVSAGKCFFKCSTTDICYEYLRKNVLEKFEFLKKNRDYCFSVGNNARSWYNENCTLGSAVKLFSQLVKLDKLF